MCGNVWFEFVPKKSLKEKKSYYDLSLKLLKVIYIFYPAIKNQQKNCQAVIHEIKHPDQTTTTNTLKSTIAAFMTN